jgi:hypothetical protein
MKPEHKKYAIVGGVLVLLLIVGFFVVRGRAKPETDISDQTPVEDVIPTVDASVKVSLEANGAQKKEVSLSASSIPAGTDSVEYELSYLTASQGLQGVIGTVPMDGKRQFDKDLTLGTCSSGTCVYHEVVGKIKLTLKFNGDYGAKLFEKEFEL